MIYHRGTFASIIKTYTLAYGDVQFGSRTRSLPMREGARLRPTADDARRGGSVQQTPFRVIVRDSPFHSNTACVQLVE